MGSLIRGRLLNRGRGGECAYLIFPNGGLTLSVFSIHHLRVNTDISCLST